MPELRQYYDVIQTSKTTPVPDSARARAARATAWKSYEETISEQKQLSESERTALVNLVANAPEGVSLEELLQQFSHDVSARGWCEDSSLTIMAASELPCTISFKGYRRQPVVLR